MEDDKNYDNPIKNDPNWVNRMKEALASPFIQAPSGMNREEMREFISSFGKSKEKSDVQ